MQNVDRPSERAEFQRVTLFEKETPETATTVPHIPPPPSISYGHFLARRIRMLAKSARDAGRYRQTVGAEDFVAAWVRRPRAGLDSRRNRTQVGRGGTTEPDHWKE